MSLMNSGETVIPFRNDEDSMTWINDEELRFARESVTIISQLSR
jgi:hypothetical protein